MKLKKGFTLIEIIVAIALIAVIGTTSFIGVKYALDSNKITSLSQVEDEILNALKIYLETDDVASKQLYGKENAVITPIKLLINKGLLDLSNTDISKEDIEKNYVVTAFMSNVTGDYQCIEAKDLRTITSWDESLSQPLYICTNSKSSQNALLENLWFFGSRGEQEIEVDYNYAVFEENTEIYRIFKVTSDSSLILVKKGSFNGIFDGLTVPIEYYERNLEHRVAVFDGSRNRYENILPSTEELQTYDGEVPVDIMDIRNTYYFKDTISSITSTLGLLHGTIGEVDYFKITSFSTNLYGYTYNSELTEEDYFYKIKLNSCVRIKSGFGTQEKPYVLTDELCS